MFTHALTRALRKNKTLRYGVPMLVSALKKKCGGGIAKAVGPQVWLGGDCGESVIPEVGPGLGKV